MRSFIPKPAMTQLTECLVCELKINNKKCFITVLYRSPSQSIETFDFFKKGLQQTIININNSNPYITVLLAILMPGICGDVILIIFWVSI